VQPARLFIPGQVGSPGLVSSISSRVVLGLTQDAARSSAKAASADPTQTDDARTFSSGVVFKAVLDIGLTFTGDRPQVDIAWRW
jgi:hypothetical protein